MKAGLITIHFGFRVCRALSSRRPMIDDPCTPSGHHQAPAGIPLCHTVCIIEERARLRARGCARGVLVEGGARMRAQARGADVSTKLNLPFPGAN